MEVLFEVRDHAFTRIAVLQTIIGRCYTMFELKCTHRTQERMIVANAV
jgi:hypothetical protein